MKRAEYMRIRSKYSPPDIRELYQIYGLIAEDGYVYVKITKVVYGFKQAAIIRYNQLIFKCNLMSITQLHSRLDCGHTEQEKNCLCVDTFGITYFSKDYVDHLLKSTV